MLAYPELAYKYAAFARLRAVPMVAFFSLSAPVSAWCAPYGFLI